MRNYIIRRLVSVPLMLIGLSLLLFLLLWVRPGSAAFGVAGGLSLDTDFERLEERMGLNKPWYEQYGKWLGNAVQGDFGNSLVPPQNTVSSQISGRVGNTIEIGLLTIIISAIIGIPIGIISAVKRNSKLDVALRTITILGISVPNFWTATLLLVLPAKFFGWTPLSTDFSTFTEDPIRNLSIVILASNHSCL